MTNVRGSVVLGKFQVASSHPDSFLGALQQYPAEFQGETHSTSDFYGEIPTFTNNIVARDYDKYLGSIIEKNSVGSLLPISRSLGV